MMIREASSPTAGAARGGVAGAVGGLVGSYVAVKTGQPELGAVATAVVVAVLVGLGKVARNSGKLIGKFF